MKRSIVAGALLALAGPMVLSACGGGAESTVPGPGPATSHAQRHEKRYVALGDSYTSAPEVGDPIGPVGCYRASQNYPHLVAKSLHLDLHDVSCGGATTADVTGRQEIASGSVPPQIDAVTRDTDVVTLSIGANDGHVLGTILETCGELALSDPKGAPCVTRAGFDRARIAGLGDVVEPRIVRLIKEIRRRAPHARVVLVGYPQMLPASGSCREVPLATGDYAMARSLNRLFDDKLRSAARRTHATYVDPWGPSTGHDICGHPPWIAGKIPLHGGVAYHPYAPEQRLVASLVEKALRG